MRFINKLALLALVSLTFTNVYGAETEFVDNTDVSLVSSTPTPLPEDGLRNLENQLAELELMIDSTITVEKTMDGFSLIIKDVLGDIDKQGLVKLNNCNQAITSFQVSKGFDLVAARNREGRMVAVVFGQKEPVITPIEFEAGIQVIVDEIDGNTVIILAKDGLYQNAYNLVVRVDLDKASQVKQYYMDHMGFSSWEEADAYHRKILQGGRLFNGVWFQPDKLYPFGMGKSARHVIEEGVIVYWETVFDESVGINLIKAWYVNPIIDEQMEHSGFFRESDLSQSYIGYEENGQYWEFMPILEQRFDYEYAYFGDKIVSYDTFLDYMIGKSAQFALAISTSQPENVEEKPESVFISYDVADALLEYYDDAYDPGNITRVAKNSAFMILSVSEVRELLTNNQMAKIHAFEQINGGVLFTGALNIADLAVNK